MERTNAYLNNFAFVLLMLYSFVLMLSNALSETLAVIILFIWIAQTIAYRRKNWLEYPLTIPIFAFIAIKLVVLVVSGYAGSINLVFEQMTLPLIYFIVPGIVVTSERRRTIAWLIIAGSIVAASIGILKFFSGAVPRAESIVSGVYTLSVFLTFSLVLVISIFAYSTKAKEKVFLALVSIPLMVCIIVTFTRASYVAALLGSIIISMVKDWKILILIIIIIAAIFTFSPGANQMLNHRFDLSNMDSFYSYRDVLLELSLPAIENPGFFGYGFNSFEKMIDKEVELRIDTKSVNNWHNVYTQHLLDSGPLSMVILFWILLAQLRYSFNIFRKTKDTEQKTYQLAFYVIVICFMLFGLVMDPLRDPIISMFFWLLMGLSLV